MKIISMLLFLFLVNRSFAQQSDNEDIKAIINRMFEGMKKGDSSIARSVFHPKAILQSIGFSAKSGKNYFHNESRLNDFMKSIGTPHAEQWDERPGTFDIKIDKQMAQVWVPYEFYLADKFNHCGVDIFTLYCENYLEKSSNNKSENSTSKSDWKIIYLVDTVRKENCVK